jgi:hypothetical protein
MSDHNVIDDIHVITMRFRFTSIQNYLFNFFHNTRTNDVNIGNTYYKLIYITTQSYFST